jgi:orotate phosphoribosyltransferase
MQIKEIYENANAYLKGHFLLSSGKHSEYYLQSAKVLENPKTSEKLANELAVMIKKSGISIDTVCSPALGGILAGYELARALNARFIFTERVEGVMSLRRGFEISQNEKVIICEDIITTGGSAQESAKAIEKLGAKIVAYSALANRGYCKRVGGNSEKSDICKLEDDLPLFALEDFYFETYNQNECPLCKDGNKAYKPGSNSGIK